MTSMQKRLMHLGLVVVAFCALSAAAVLAAPDSAAQPSAPASPAEKSLARLRLLAQQDRWYEVIERFESEDLSAWPEAGEAFHLRGKGYLFLKDAAKAERDLKAAVERDPEEEFFWYFLAEAYQQLLKDDARALEAYKKAFELVAHDELVGNSRWMPADAAVKAVNILLYQVKNDAALEILQRYGDEELKKLHPYGRCRILRAYARVYAAQGREAEALAKFREALIVELSV